MATRIQIEPLRKESNVSRWLERFTAIMEWEDVDVDKQKHALLASLGPDAYDLIADATVPSKPSEKSFQELVDLIKQQLQPPKLPIAARYEFYQIRQGNDNVSTFLWKLRAASEECAFGAQLEDRLRDQFVMGLSGRDVVKKMLTEKLEQLTLERATEIATAHEAVQKSQQRMAGDSPSSAGVCALKSKFTASSRKGGKPFSASTTASTQKPGDTCDCCGKSGHIRPNCRFREYKCNQCGKVGHLKAACRGGRSGKGRESKNSVQILNEEDVLFNIGNGRFHRVVRINDRQVKMVFDTGADVSLINERVHAALGGYAKIPLQKRSKPLMAYGGEEIQTLGESSVVVEDAGRQQRLPVNVVRGTSPCIYGGDWIRLLRPNFTVNSIGKSTVALSLKEGSHPIFFKPHPIAYGIRDAVRKELNRLVAEGVLVKVDQSDWATPIVPVKKPDGRIQLCGDYKVTLQILICRTWSALLHLWKTSSSACRDQVGSRS